MAATPMTDALAIATALAAAESAHPDSPELASLHSALRVGLYRHASALGLTPDNVSEIDNLGTQQRGGGAKDAAPEVDGGEG